jgi:hypothetical protein
MQGSYTTLYLRHRFTVADPSLILAVQLNTIIDDGFIAWVNGTRVASTNAPATDAAATRTSVATVATEPFTAAFDLPDPSRYLVAGENTLAVLVLNGALSSSDLVFDAELVSTMKVSPIPIIAAIDPAPGFVTELRTISVTFSEPVSGVRAQDFLINGVSAEGLAGTGAITFSFPQPPFERWTFRGGLSMPSSIWTTRRTGLIQAHRVRPGRINSSVQEDPLYECRSGSARPCAASGGRGHFTRPVAGVDAAICW